MHPTIRILYLTDVHGSEMTLRKAVHTARKFKADVLLLGGDLLSKDVAVLESRGGKLFFKGYEVGLGEVMEYSRISGVLPVVVEREHSPAEVMEATEGVLEEQSRRLSKILGEAKDFKVVSGLGDYDVDSLRNELEENNVIVAEDTPREVGTLTFYSLGCSVMGGPMRKRVCTDSTLYDKFSKVLGTVEVESSVLMSHLPPLNSVLASEGEGSQAVRDVIERYQPLMSLHGHVHSKFAQVRFGDTVSLNPGSGYLDGTLQAFLVQVEREIQGIGRAVLRNYVVKKVVRIME